MPKEQLVKMVPDLKRLYEDVLSRENTRAIMFMFGHYFPSFFSKIQNGHADCWPTFFRQLQSTSIFILPRGKDISQTICTKRYSSMYIQKLYERGIGLAELEILIASNSRIQMRALLPISDWRSCTTKRSILNIRCSSPSGPEARQRHGEFVRFLGRMFVSGQNADANELLKQEPRAPERLKAFWDWALSTCPNASLFTEFGFWINIEKSIFEPKWLAERVRKTLEKTKGFLEWDYGLVRSIVELAQNAPQETLTIAQLYLLESAVRNRQQRRIPTHIDREWLQAFKVLHNNPATKKGTYALVDDLIREGGSTFWRLKEILQ